MPRYFSILILAVLLLTIACNNIGSTTNIADNDSTNNDVLNIKVDKKLQTPFQYSCYGKNSLQTVFAKEAGFTHARHEGASYAGEIMFNSKCKDVRYFLFTYPGDVLVPMVDVYEKGKYKDRINIYVDLHGCAGDMGYHRNETTFFKENGKIFSVGTTEEFELDPINFDPIDSTRKITSDTLVLDLKDYCMR